MTTNANIPTLFGPEQVHYIVQNEFAKGWVENLLARTTTQVRIVTWISNSESLPTNLGLWVHRYWKSAIATDPNIPMRPFTEAEWKPIDLISLHKKV